MDISTHSICSFHGKSTGEHGVSHQIYQNGGPGGPLNGHQGEGFSTLNRLNHDVLGCPNDHTNPHELATGLCGMCIYIYVIYIYVIVIYIYIHIKDSVLDDSKHGLRSLTLAGDRRSCMDSSEHGCQTSSNIAKGCKRETLLGEQNYVDQVKINAR